MELVVQKRTLVVYTQKLTTMWNGLKKILRYLFKIKNCSSKQNIPMKKTIFSLNK